MGVPERALADDAPEEEVRMRLVRFHRVEDPGFQCNFRSAPPSSLVPYDRRLLVRLCYECAQEHKGAEERFLATFFGYEGASRDVAAPVEPLGQEPDRIRDLYSAKVDAFADRLVDELFLPLKAIAKCRSSVEYSEDDAHSSSESVEEWSAETPPRTSGSDPDRPDSVSVPPSATVQEPERYSVYIFPPSPLTQADEDGNLSESGQLAASLLSLLDPEGPDLLRSAAESSTHRDSINSVKLDHRASTAFSEFHLFLYPTKEDFIDPNPDLFQGKALGKHAEALQDLARQKTLQPHVSRNLLRLHGRIARILDISGVGAYIDSVLADTGVEDFDAGGATNLGRLMQLRLDGWWDGGRSKRPKGDDLESDFWIESSRFTEEQYSEN